MADSDNRDQSEREVVGQMPRWEKIIQATTSPIKLFALIVLVCNTVFGVAATMVSPEVFVYTLQTFLAVVAAFTLMALWSPRSFYSPSELASLMELEAKLGGKHVFPKGRPWVMTLVFAAGLIIYALYQYKTR